jgi:hypothetical protein
MNSDSGEYFCVMQNDGNLCIYKGSGPENNQGYVFGTSNLVQGYVNLQTKLENIIDALSQDVKYIKRNDNLPNFVIAVGGQSNSQGYGGVYETTNSQDQPHDRILSWNAGYDVTQHTSVEMQNQQWFNTVETPKWEIANLQTNSFGTKPVNFQSFAFHFAKILVHTYPDIVVGIINCGLGAQQISRWLLKENGDIYNFHKNMIMNSGISKINVILWHQGESDAMKQSGYYKDAINEVISQYRSESFCDHNTPFIVGEVLSTGEWRQVNNELLDLNIDDDISTECIKSADLEYSAHWDTIHFSTESHRILGRRYYDAYKKILLMQRLKRLI